MVFWRSHKPHQQKQSAACWPEVPTSSEADLRASSQHVQPARHTHRNSDQLESGHTAVGRSRALEVLRSHHTGAAVAGPGSGNSIQQTASGGKALSHAEDGSGGLSAAAPVAMRCVSGSALAPAALQPPDTGDACSTGCVADGDTRQHGVASTGLTTARQVQSKQALRARQSVKAAPQLPHSDSLCFDDDALQAAAAQHKIGPAVQAAAVRQRRQPLASGVVTSQHT
jgi:hypothetical protein